MKLIAMKLNKLYHEESDFMKYLASLEAEEKSESGSTLSLSLSSSSKSSKSSKSDLSGFLQLIKQMEGLAAAEEKLADKANSEEDPKGANSDRGHTTEDSEG